MSWFKRKWECLDCSHVNKRTRTKWVRVTNGNQAGIATCYKCGGRVKELSA